MTIKTLLVIAAISGASFCLWGVARTATVITFNQNCGGYLARAADANTLELAATALEHATAYARQHDLTSGYTSIFWRTPDEDIGFCYTNITAALTELRTLDAGAAPLEKSNLLMKLRESLTGGSEGTSLTVPTGISVYPYNGLFALWGTASFVVMASALVTAMIKC